MLEIVVHVGAIAVVIGYVEYRLRSYAALMHRFDQLDQSSNRLTTNILDSNSSTSKLLVSKVNGLEVKLGESAKSIAENLELHQGEVMEASKSGMRQVRDSVSEFLTRFSESLWKGVHNMAQSVQLPPSPLFTCYYCHQKFPVTIRERIGENDYCPEHGFKRQVKEVATVRIPVMVQREEPSGPMPWESK